MWRGMAFAYRATHPIGVLNWVRSLVQLLQSQQPQHVEILMDCLQVGNAKNLRPEIEGGLLGTIVPKFFYIFIPKAECKVTHMTIKST